MMDESQAPSPERPVMPVAGRQRWKVGVLQGAEVFDLTAEPPETKDYEKHVTVKGMNCKVPVGWSEEKCLEEKFIELPTHGLSKIFLPITCIEDLNFVAPTVYAYDCSCHTSFKMAYKLTWRGVWEPDVPFTNKLTTELQEKLIQQKKVTQPSGVNRLKATKAIKKLRKLRRSSRQSQK